MNYRRLTPCLTLATLIFVASCGGSGQTSVLPSRSPQGQQLDSVVTQQAPSTPKAVMAPRSCEEPEYGITTKPDQPLVGSADKPVDLSIQFYRGSGQYFVKGVEIQVLPPDAPETKAGGTAGELTGRSPNAIAVAERTNFSASDTSIVLRFNGKDSAGVPLRSGLYTAAFHILTAAAPDSACAANGPGGWQTTGVLAVIDWRKG